MDADECVIAAWLNEDINTQQIIDKYKSQNLSGRTSALQDRMWRTFGKTDELSDNATMRYDADKGYKFSKICKLYLGAPGHGGGRLYDIASL